MDQLADLLREQDGVVSRRQVLDLGHDDEFLRRAVRRRELRRVHPGVYVDHTGPLTWRQRAWAAVLLYWPAALTHESVLRLHGVLPERPARDQVGQEEPAAIHVAIDHRRTVVEQDGTRVVRVRRLDGLLQPARRLAQVRLEHAVLAVASEASTDEAAIAVLAQACQRRRTTAQRLLVALEERKRLPRRRFLREVLADVAEGAYSVLEHRYLTKVERPHGLPTAKRQRSVRLGRSSAYRDVEYLQYGLVVELDGRLGHEEQLDRWEDLDRDIDTALSGGTTVRLGWRHALSPCRTATVVGRLLRALGWTGQLKVCSPGCSVEHVRAGSRGDAA